LGTGINSGFGPRSGSLEAAGGISGLGDFSSVLGNSGASTAFSRGCSEFEAAPDGAPETAGESEPVVAVGSAGVVERS
jgi:hypothetical protein